MAYLAFSVLPLFLFASLTYAGEWSHDPKHALGPEAWAHHYPACGGKKQSPIAFWKDEVTIDQSMPELNLDMYKYTIPENKLLLSNNGHALQLDIPSEIEIRISAGGLPDWYKLVQFHFHWGSTDITGSEHWWGSNAFPLVVHFVHVKNGKHLEQKWDDPEDLAVIGVGFHVTSSPNPELEKITNQIREVAYRKEDTPLRSAMTLINLLPKNYSNFFRYPGSLTTPPCWESVVWTVLTDTVGISMEQLSLFRELFGSERGANSATSLNGNFRPLQPLNGRKVTLRSAMPGLPNKPTGAPAPAPAASGGHGAPAPAAGGHGAPAVGSSVGGAAEAYRKAQEAAAALKAAEGSGLEGHGLKRNDEHASGATKNHAGTFAVGVWAAIVVVKQLMHP